MATMARRNPIMVKLHTSCLSWACRGAREGPEAEAFAMNAASEARDLAQEWTEQRSIFHSRLYEQCIRPPLQVGDHGKGKGLKCRYRA